MKKKSLLLFAVFCFVGCASNKKEEIPVIDTKLNQGQNLGGDSQVGQNSSGAMVYQEKSNVLQNLVNLENEVMLLQDEVYGTEKYKSKGLFGKVKDCRKKQALKTGEMKYIPEKTIVMDEDQPKVGIEAGTQQYISWTEEKISDRTKRFQGYKQKFLDIREELEDFLEKCEVAAGQTRQ